MLPGRRLTKLIFWELKLGFKCPTATGLGYCAMRWMRAIALGIGIACGSLFVVFAIGKGFKGHTKTLWHGIFGAWDHLDDYCHCCCLGTWAGWRVVAHNCWRHYSNAVWHPFFQSTIEPSGNFPLFILSQCWLQAYSWVMHALRVEKIQDNFSWPSPFAYDILLFGL